MSIDTRLANLNRKGRQPGAKNKSTVAREALASAAIVLLAEKLTPEELAELTPLHVLLSVMAARFKAGDLLAAASVATAAAPYVHARKSPNPTDPVIPPELQADPLPTPDEPARRAVSFIESFSMLNQNIKPDDKPGCDAHAALREIYRNPRLPIRQRVAAAAEAIAYEKHPAGDEPAAED